MKFCLTLLIISTVSLTNCQKKEAETATPTNTEAQASVNSDTLGKEPKKKTPLISMEIVTESTTTITKPEITNKVTTHPARPASQGMKDVLKANEHKKVPKLTIPTE